MTRPFLALASASLLAACGGGADTGNATATTETAAAPPGAPAPAAAPPLGADAGTAAPSLAGRTRELTNPDEFTMVLLYYSLSGLAPPVEKWVENDSTIRYGKPEEKQGLRDAMRAKIAAGLAAVKDVGVLRLTTGAELSEYDPGYGEYTVRAFAPSRSMVFDELGEKIQLKFDNAQKAQRWAVPQAEAQAIKDKIPYSGDVMADVRVKVASAAPDGDGGTIAANVLDYELKNRGSGTTVARVAVAQ